jgi:UDP-N-acetylmuramyl pentapeptide phosphotransferase/UDP-N-acetylglucosamine-1-phosphate transferase
VTAVRVWYFLGVIAFGYGGVRVLDYLETQEKSRLVSGLVAAAVGMILMIIGGLRYRRMPPEERRPISGESRLPAAIALVMAAILVTFGALCVWVMFTPDGGSMTSLGIALFFGMAALGLVDARRKLRASRQRSIRAQPGRPGGSSS